MTLVLALRKGAVSTWAAAVWDACWEVTSSSVPPCPVTCDLRQVSDWSAPQFMKREQ